MNYWFKHLPSYIKQDWKGVLEVFVSRYCTDHTPARLRYYKLTQKQDESIVNYLYRLNAAAQLAGVDYRSSAQDLQEHVQQFFDSALDKALPIPFKIRQYESVDELKEVLVQYEASQFGQHERQQFSNFALQVE
ncbi:hypothetical protein PINS_up016077 [Pythium insidiosum]|nr:hypothetical protein PINS_up016077 [Pythium insidiosum]